MTISSGARGVNESARSGATTAYIEHCLIASRDSFTHAGASFVRFSDGKPEAIGIGRTALAEPAPVDRICSPCANLHQGDPSR
jgi:hypothetical protein